MSKIFAIHTIELKPGVKPETFEKFIAEAVNRLPSLKGWTTHIAKGDRGERRGKYVVIHVFDSMETRDMYFPLEGGQSADEVQQLFDTQEMQVVGEQWETYATSLMKTVYTDYVVLD